MSLSDLISQGHKIFSLDSIGSWPDSSHQFNEDHMKAVLAAWYAERPLLIKGEPGVGKSQLARATAQVLGWQFISVNIQPRTEYQDLLWEFDAVARLAQAQILPKPASGTCAVLPEQLERDRYIVPGPLWWAIRPGSAKAQKGLASQRPCPELMPEDDLKCKENVVLLIDEIDKADANLPNGLLEFLGNTDFTLPVDTESTKTEKRRPLVMITSNDERDMPEAFMRRCFVLNLALPEKRDDLVGFLVKRAEAHAAKDELIKKVVVEVRKEAAELVVKFRNNTPKGMRKPSPAEYLDLLKSIGGMGDEEQAQRDSMSILAGVVLKKDGVIHQNSLVDDDE